MKGILQLKMEQQGLMMNQKNKDKTKQNKKKVLTKEDFFKALDKAILTVKKQKLPAKGKKKTSE